MSSVALSKVAADRVFGPRTRFADLAYDHVPFESLAGGSKIETAAVRGLTAESSPGVTVLGPIGGGKSSLIAHVCQGIPETHIALRVPVAGADDATDVSIMAAVALNQALSDLEFEDYQRQALEGARADRVTTERTAPRVSGGKLGGGPVPLELTGELGTLRNQLQTDKLGTERLAGLDRLVTILVARGVQPIFVLEDTEAAIGGGASDERIEGFFNGPVRAFIHEVDAPCLIAVQDHLAYSPTFKELVPNTELVELPHFNDQQARTALVAIIDQRLEHAQISEVSAEILGPDALEGLVSFYDEAGRSLRHVLAALQSSADHAEDMSADRIEAGHVAVGTTEWRQRF